MIHRLHVFSPSCVLIVICSTFVRAGGATMERVQVAADHRSFELAGSGARLVPWGFNYGHHGQLLEDIWESDWPAVEHDFHDMRALGANVARIHLQFPKFMDALNRPNPKALARLTRLLKLAESDGIYLDLTGLASYRKADRAVWYDALSDKDRWTAQANFWEAIAQTCADSPAVFCYDLMNEPINSGKRSDGWYAGPLGGYYFLQRLSLDQPTRPADDIAREWSHTLIAAIRKSDNKHLITIGMLPSWGIPLKAVAPELDFVAVHIYPAAGKVDDAIKNLKQFDIGKPVVIEETFPLSCGVADERAFLLKSRGIAAGWLGHYDGQSIVELQALQRSGKLTLAQGMWLDWLKLFKEIGPKMKRPGASP
jgi:hypothetical protein